MDRLNKHILFSILLLILVIAFFESTNLDIILQNLLYHAESHTWLLYDDAGIIRLLFYDGIKALYLVFVLLIFCTLLFFSNHKTIQRHRMGLRIVLLSCILVPAMINGIKSISNVPCPKDISLYGGDHPYSTLLQRPSQSLTPSGTMRCYPAGHASGGFALLSLYYLFSSVRAKRIAVTSTLILGWILGIYKMMIGDHFLSHTLVSMILAWLLISIIARICQWTAMTTTPAVLRKSPP